MIKDKWHPPPAKVCKDCKETLTIFNTSEHNICTSCNIKRLKIIENKKEKRYQEFLMYKLKQEKEAKMLRKRQQLLELGIDVGNDGDDSEKSKKKKRRMKKKKKKKKKQQTDQEKQMLSGNNTTTTPKS